MGSGVSRTLGVGGGLYNGTFGPNTTSRFPVEHRVSRDRGLSYTPESILGRLFRSPPFSFDGRGMLVLRVVGGGGRTRVEGGRWVLPFIQSGSQ